MYPTGAFRWTIHGLRLTFKGVMDMDMDISSGKPSANLPADETLLDDLAAGHVAELSKGGVGKRPAAREQRRVAAVEPTLGPPAQGEPRPVAAAEKELLALERGQAEPEQGDDVTTAHRMEESPPVEAAGRRMRRSAFCVYILLQIGLVLAGCEIGLLIYLLLNSPGTGE